MAKLPVRTAAGERRRTPVEGEPLGTRWDPFRQVAPFLTGDDESARFKPDFKIENIEGGFLFRAELPGIKENEIDIAVSGNRLTISGHIYDSRDCAFASFTSAFTLPEASGGNRKIHAALDRGVLTVLWSKRPEHAPETTPRPGDDPLARWESEGGISEEPSAVRPGS